VRLVELDALPPEVRTALEGDEHDPFDAARIPPIAWRKKTHHVVAYGDDRRPIASTGTLVASVEVAGGRFEVVGVGGVLVNAQHRGHGLARIVVTAALDRAAPLGHDFAVLFCFEDRAGLYAKLGFAAVADAVTVEQPDGPLVIPQVTMWRPFRPGARWPDGPVTVLGQPF
jgi:GNAT superfamily N-acetyltransferase